MNFDEYRRFDATGLATLIRRRDVTPLELLEIAQARADAVDDALNFITVDDDDFARQRLAGKRLVGPFAGVPFLFKDLFAFLEGTALTNGSRLMSDFVAPATSTLVQRCLDAGLVPFAKTASPEFGLNAVSEPVLHGPCRNPWNPDFSPGGSSGGAGVAVAAGVVPMAHATDGGGSIRIPASNCALVGLKPSRARTPVGPVVGEAWNGLAGGHVLCRSLRDCAVMLDLLGGGEPGDPYACPAPVDSFAVGLDEAPEGLRIGVMTRAPTGNDAHEECVGAVEMAAKLLGDLGHHVEPAAPEFDGEQLLEAEIAIVAVNTANDLARWSTELGRQADESSVEAITLALAEHGQTVSGQVFARALAGMHMLARSFGRFFTRYDILLSPTLATPPLPIGSLNQNGRDLQSFIQATFAHMPFTPLYNMSGCPALSLPLSWNSQGLPVGAMFGAALGREDLLLRLGRQIEQAAPWFDRVPVVDAA